MKTITNQSLVLLLACVTYLLVSHVTPTQGAVARTRNANQRSEDELGSLRRAPRDATQRFNISNLSSTLRIYQRLNRLETIEQSANVRQRSNDYCQQDQLCGCEQEYNEDRCSLSVKCQYVSPCGLDLHVYRRASRCFVMRLIFIRFGATAPPPVVDYSINLITYPSSQTIPMMNTVSSLHVDFPDAVGRLDTRLREIIANPPTDDPLPDQGRPRTPRKYQIKVRRTNCT